MKKVTLLLFALVQFCLVAQAQDPVIVDGVLQKWEGAADAITIPDEVVEIAPNCFFTEGDPDEWGQSESESNTRITSINLNNVKKIGKNAFRGCVGINTIQAPNLEEVGENAFKSCSGLTALNLPVIKTIGTEAFADCVGLSKVTLGNTLTAITGEAFKRCTALTSIKMQGAGKYSVKNNAILSAEKTLVYLAGAATEITLGAGECTAIGPNAMQSNAELKKITLPGVTVIEDKAFMMCRGLAEIYVPKLQKVNGDLFTWMGVGQLSILDIHESTEIQSLGSSFNDKPATTIYVANEAVKTRLKKLYPKSNYVIGSPTGLNTYKVIFDTNNHDAGTIEAWRTGGTAINSGEEVAAGQMVKVKALAYHGFQIKNWIVNGVEHKSFPNEMTPGQIYTNNAIDGPLTIMVNFEKKPELYTIFFKSKANAAYGKIECKTTTGKTVNTTDEVEPGTKLIFTATPAEGYHVTEWYKLVMVDGVEKEEVIPGQTNKTTYECEAVDMLDIRVDFERAAGSHIVKFESLNKEGGSIKAAVDGKDIQSNAVVADGSKVVFTALPKEGYVVDAWLLDNKVQEDQKENTFVIESLKADVTVSLILTRPTPPVENLPEIENGHLKHWTPKGEAVTPNGVTHIDTRAFEGANKMTSFMITKDVQSIGELAFLYCTKLNKITVDPANPYFKEVNGVVYTKDLKKLVAYPLGNSAESYEILKSTQSIMPGAFASAMYLTGVTVAQGNTALKAEKGALYAMDGTTLFYYPVSYPNEKITLKEGITRIARYGLAFNFILDKLQLPSTLKTIDNLGMCYNYKMSQMKWAKDVAPQLEEVGDSAFYQNRAMIFFSYSGPLKKMGKSAFETCTGLTEVVIPENCVIGECCFKGCWALQNVYVYQKTPQTIADDMFHDIQEIATATLHVPTGTAAAYKAALGWKHFKKIADDIQLAAGINGVTVNGNVKVVAQDNGYVIEGLTAGQRYAVYNVSGVMVASGVADGNNVFVAVKRGQIHVLHIAGVKAIKLY